jgi:hypothetical protein
MRDRFPMGNGSGTDTESMTILARTARGSETVYLDDHGAVGRAVGRGTMHGRPPGHRWHTPYRGVEIRPSLATLRPERHIKRPLGGCPGRVPGDFTGWNGVPGRNIIRLLPNNRRAPLKLGVTATGGGVSRTTGLMTGNTATA